MQPERWSRVRDIVGEVLEIDPPSRPAAISRACAGDAELRTEVERLVRSFDEVHSAEWTPAVRLFEEAERDQTPVLQAGDLVAGRYRVTTALGRGGMGEVYEAREGSHFLALKLVRWNRLGDERARKRLLREGHLAQRIEHAHVCRVFGIEEHVVRGTGALAVLIMERLEGETLAARLSRGRCSVEETLTWGRQMAEALQAAHDAGVVHRDFKPSNVMLTPDRGAVVMDFGLAVATTTAWPAESTLTSSGVLVGTPEYMPPEQLREQQVTPRTDQYALAAVLFEMLAGVRHSQGATGVDEIVRRITERPPDVRQWAPAAARWSKPLQRALDPDPESRFASVTELMEAVERAPRRWPWAAAAVALIALGSFWWWNRLEGVVRLGLVAESEEARVLASAALGLSNFYRVVPLPSSGWEAAAEREKCAYVARIAGQGRGVKLTLDRLQGWRRQWECAEGGTLNDGVETCALRTRQWVGDPSLAEARYQGKLREITTASPEALRFFLAGEAFTRSSKRAEAVAEFSKAVNLDDGFAQAHRRLGDVYFGLSDYARGINHYEKALGAARAGRASVCQTLQIQGQFSLDTGDRAAARPVFEEMTRSCAPNPAIHFYLASIYRSLKLTDAARRELSEVERLAPRALYALNALAQEAFLARDAIGLDGRVRQLEETGYSSFAIRWRGVALQQRGDVKQAQVSFAKLCEGTSNPEDGSYGCSLLAHSQAEAGELSKAFEVLSQSAATEERNNRLQEAAAKRVAAAWLAFHLGRRAEATKLVYSAVETGTEPTLLSHSAVVLRLLEQEGMLVQLSGRLRSLARFPRFRAALHRVDAELAGLRGDHRQALELLVQGMQLESANAERVTLARMYVAAGEEPRAEHILLEEVQRPGRCWADALPALPAYQTLAIELKKGR